MKHVTTLITDLDNTLFDWFGIWHSSFRAMLDKLVELSGIDEDTLVKSFKPVHEKHGTSEYAFAIEELSCLRDKHGNEDFLGLYKEAIYAYRDARNQALKLYPGIDKTFAELIRKGCRLVGYTESQAYYTHYRLRHLNLDLFLDYIYSPPDHEIPDNFEAELISLRHTIQRHTPRGEIKPNPNILLKIIEDINATPSEVVYVGDSLIKDMQMALDAGITCVHAKYGVSHEKEEYELLQRVTHWTEEMVQREQQVTHRETRADYVIEQFDDLLDLFQFTSFADVPSEQSENTIEAWKTCVDVQKHFNELSIKIRQLALTIVTAAFAGAALSIREEIAFSVWEFRMPLATPILSAAAGVWFAFYLMDRFWYHELLLGSVKHGISIESETSSSMPELGLATAIGKNSPNQTWPWVGRLLDVPVVGGFLKLLGIDSPLHSSNKLDLFYRCGFALLLISALTALFAGKRVYTEPLKPPVPVEITLDVGELLSKNSTNSSSDVNAMSSANKQYASVVKPEQAKPVGDDVSTQSSHVAPSAPTVDESQKPKAQSDNKD